MRPDLTQKIVAHLIDTLVAVDFDEFALLAVVVEQVNGFLKKDVKPFLDGFATIVGALIEFTAIDITYTGCLGWTGAYVINVLVGTADISS